MERRQSHRAERLALTAVVTGWIGVGLTLPYYGAEGFGLNAIARKAADSQVSDLLGLVEAVRFSPAAITTFGLGLLLLAAVAIWRSGVLARSSGILFAAGLVLFLPQFFTPSAVRIAHGVLVAAGSIWLALALWQAKAAPAQW